MVDVEIKGYRPLNIDSIEGIDYREFIGKQTTNAIKVLRECGGYDIRQAKIFLEEGLDADVPLYITVDTVRCPNWHEQLDSVFKWDLLSAGDGPVSKLMLARNAVRDVKLSREEPDTIEHSLVVAETAIELAWDLLEKEKDDDR